MNIKRGANWMDEIALVSIIVPVYNTEVYLRTCIESIIRQTYNNLDVILVDDGSSDNSLNICLEMEKLDSRIRVYSKINGGVSNARNDGIEMARGNYIMFVDSDDYIEHDMVEKMLARVHKGWLVVCNWDSNERQNAYLYGGRSVKLGKEDFWGLYKNRQISSVWNKLYEREKIGETVRFEGGLSIGEDLLFNLNYMLDIKGFIYLDEIFYHYRNGRTSGLSNSYSGKMYDKYLSIYRTLITFCTEQISMTEPQWVELYWYFFKALQRSFDVEYEANPFGASNFVRQKMNSEEFKKVFEKVYQNKSKVALKGKIEIILYQHNLWKIDYYLRKTKRKISV